MSTSVSAIINKRNIHNIGSAAREWKCNFHKSKIRNMILYGKQKKMLRYVKEISKL